MAYRKFKKLFINITDLDDSSALLRIINQIQSNIEASVASIVALVQNDSQVLTNIQLEAGKTNVINHHLGKKLSGWKLRRVRGICQVWDTQDDNPSQNLTLWLHTDTNVSVDLEVD